MEVIVTKIATMPAILVWKKWGNLRNLCKATADTAEIPQIRAMLKLKAAKNCSVSMHKRSQ